MSDEGDPTITFDDDGLCRYCREASREMATTYFPNEEGERKLKAVITELKEAGRGKKYDCLMGVSGGLDSSYLAYLGSAKWGLRIAAVHIDDGYDTEISKANIAKLSAAAHFDLVTITPDAEQFNALTLAYMKAGVPNLAVPQDNILFACLYDFAREHGIKHFLSGGNFALESILQSGNSWDADDVVNLYDIHEQYGDKPIDKLHFITKQQKLKDQRLLGIKTFRPLNYIDYNRNQAFAELAEFCDFEYYGRKHLENYLTAFLQLCWLPEKFGVDKRTSHLSSMIISGQMSREEALKELEQPLMTDVYRVKLHNILCSGLGISQEQLDALIAAPAHQHDEFRIDKVGRFATRMKGVLIGRVVR